ncbi:MAG: phenylalanine--tRNA ligase subunit beta [Planctomycetaceae bacterium]
MIISANWLADYVRVSASLDEVVERLLMSGLNHESSTRVGDDTAIELEVTSNRPDCLGHVGVAREVAVLFGRPLHVPDPRPLEAAGDAARSVRVEILAPDICPCYTARVIRGVRVGPSPKWLVERLATVGVASVNNVVDVTNYVMLECGQPLHAFDLAAIRSGRIVVRRAAEGEPFTAINHKTYALSERMCVIADAERPVALAGVMGGAETEITAATTDVLLESAQFAPLAVRAAARTLVLASGSSYRFERGPDPAMVDWASRRAAALILELAGGTLERGAVVAGRLACAPATIRLAAERVGEVLGVDVADSRQRRILTSLGFVEEPGQAPHDHAWRAPTWRRDCWREIDLVEEIARIEGYDRVPEDAVIAARPIELSPREVTIRRVSDLLVGAGLCEAMTRSVVSEALAAMPSPWGDTSPLTISPPLVRGADRLRRSLLPSLLEARAGNVAVGVDDADLFEIARAYLSRPADAAAGSGPVEEPLLTGIVVGGDFFRAKAVCDAVLAGLGLPASTSAAALAYRPIDLDPCARGRAAEVVLVRPDHAPERIAVVGEVATADAVRLGLVPPVAAAEIRLDRLAFAATSEQPLVKPSDFPAVQRDVNLVVDEAVAWGDVEAAIQTVAGASLERCRLVQVWRDTDRLGAGHKSFVVALTLRSATGTLSGDEAGSIVDGVVGECGRRVGAVLRGA